MKQIINGKIRDIIQCNYCGTVFYFDDRDVEEYTSCEGITEIVRCPECDCKSPVSDAIKALIDV